MYPFRAEPPHIGHIGIKKKVKGFDRAAGKRLGTGRYTSVIIQKESNTLFFAEVKVCLFLGFIFVRVEKST